MNKNLYVTQPTLPPLDEFVEYLKEIWESKLITNMGPFHKLFEEALAKYLGVEYISLFANGTLALITALQALRITGEVITTPYSFVATTHSLWWNNIKPVFVDIEPKFFNLNPENIEAAITPKTKAIMPVHVYGNPCKIDEIQYIADKHGLKVIFDAAHAFGVTINGKSIMHYGDLSVMSFHATKVFNTIEGGAIVCHDPKTKERIDYLKNFGFADEITVVEPGINAKMNELQSAYGLLQLKYVDEYINKRRIVTNYYRSELSGIPGIRFNEDMVGIRHSYTYFPILIDSEEFGQKRNKVYERLKKNNIFCRRYFYPLISNMTTYKEFDSSNQENLPIANKISNQVICLPLNPYIEKKDVNTLCKILTSQNA